MSTIISRTYVVQPGDTLSEIAEEFGRSVMELAQVNRIHEPSHIEPGWVLVIPGNPMGLEAREKQTMRLCGKIRAVRLVRPSLPHDMLEVVVGNLLTDPERTSSKVGVDGGELKLVTYASIRPCVGDDVWITFSFRDR